MPAPRKSLNNKRWRRIRAIQLSLEPLCRDCARQGQGTEATEVDHIDGGEHEGQYEPGKGYTNLQSLCKPCHSTKTWHQVRGLDHRPVDADGNPPGWE